jgi:hypothetical protein
MAVLPRLFYAAMMRRESVLSKPPAMSGQRRWRDAKRRIWPARRAKRNDTLHDYVVRLAPALFLFASVTAASAETVAETASRWGLIGRWSVDCQLPPDHDRGAVLSYQVVGRSRVVLRRDFGDSEDQADVVAAEISRDNLLSLRIYFPQLKQTRELGLRREPDGRIRAIYNRTRKGEYSIRDGHLTASGQPTPPQYRCGE